MDERSFALPTRLSKFVSFDGRVIVTTFHQRPDRYRQLEVTPESIPRIARGGGLSYAGASFGAGVLVQEMTLFSRILDYDPTDRLLRVEAGATAGDILSWALRRNLCLPVVPGYPGITVGGCIAADVHGKNPRLDGTFRDWVRAFTLYHPTLGFIQASPETHGDLFDTTCGGFGLTGIIVDATLRLVPLPAASVRFYSIRVSSLQQAAECILTSSAPFSYSWHGGVLNASRIGDGLVFSADWEPGSIADAPSPARRQLTAEDRGRLPFCLWNRLTVPAASWAFMLANSRRSRSRTMSVSEACFPFEQQQMYHRFFGGKGFGEMQLLISVADFNRFVDRLAAVITQQRPLITFMSIKAFRGGSRALSLSGEGLLLAIDYVRSPTADGFESSMDRLILDTGAQPNVSKDSRISASVAGRSLPGYMSFVESVHRIDPRRTFQSDLARRLNI
jgi:decaprenylphospho-beta-D-ribofuranose 2-oxidase